MRRAARLLPLGLAACAVAAVSLQFSASAHAWPIDTKGDGCAAPTWPEAPSTADSSRVLVVGDSLVRDSRASLERQLVRKGWLPSVRCWGAKGSDWGAEQVRMARAEGQLPDTVVVSLGTNDVWWLHIPMEIAVDQMMAALGKRRTVYWVDLYFGPNGYDDLPKSYHANRILQAKAEQYPNLRIIDFAREYKAAIASDARVGWVDGVHLNEYGYSVRSRIIAGALGAPVTAVKP